MIHGKIFIHVRAPILTLSGYGVHSRQLFDYLLSDDRFLIGLEAINWGHTAYIHEHPLQKKYYECMHIWNQAVEQKVQPDISIQLTIPNEFKKVAQINIGVTAGIEVDRITKEWVAKCNEMDLIVVPSTFSQRVMTETIYHWKNKETNETGEIKITKPVQVIPEWFEKPTEIKSLEIDFPTKYNFLHVGQWGNKGGFGEDRKNIADLIRIFCSTFRRDVDVGLVLKINIIRNCEEDFLRTKEKIEEIKSNFPDLKCKIYLIHDSLTDEEMWSLYSHPKINALVSFTHGEGFGLPLLEASAAGLSIVATNWSGHVDFLRPKQGFLPIEYTLKEIPECQIWAEVIDKGSKWASIDEKDAVKQLKRIIDAPISYRKQAKENIRWLTENFSKDVIMLKWRDFFNQFVQEEQERTTSNKTEHKPQFSSQKEQVLTQLRSQLRLKDDDTPAKEKVLFILPQSAGDILMSTVIVDSLIKSRHFDADFYFATKEEYKSLLEGLVELYNINVINYDELMMNAELTREVWDVVYNPGVNIQYTFSNWLLGNGEYSIRLLEEFAKQCNLHPRDITDYTVKVKETSLPDKKYVTFGPGGIKTAKVYKYWDDVIINLKEMLPELEIIQLGAPNEKLYDGVQDYRSMSYAESFHLIKNAVFHFGVDTFSAHAAAAMETPHLIIYGSTDPLTVTPVLLGKKKPLQVLLQTQDRHGCKSPCYKNECFMIKDGRNCLSEIKPQILCEQILHFVEQLNKNEKI